MIALVFGVMSAAQRSGEGRKPSCENVCNEMGVIPSIVRDILSPKFSPLILLVESN